MDQKSHFKYFGISCICAVKLYVNLQSLSGMLHLRHGPKEALFLVARGAAHRMRILQAWHNSSIHSTFRTAAYLIDLLMYLGSIRIHVLYRPDRLGS